MLTEFGKECRKLRIDKGEFLADMAGKLGVAASFLSAVENGKKNVPRDWCKKLQEIYRLSVSDYERFVNAAERSASQVKITIDGLSDGKKDLILSFARSFDKLQTKEQEEIFAILNKFNDEG